jgi:DnaJ-domain-containing protein 1
MLAVLPDLLAIAVFVLIGTIIIGIPYSIFVSLPRAFRRGLEESLNSVDGGASTASPTGKGWHSSRDTHSGDPETESDHTPRGSAILECRADALAVLGVSTDATEAEIKAAYRRLVSEWHPDRLNNVAKELRDIATERLKTINQAYDQLVRSS